jgi:hypothetical protein
MHCACRGSCPCRNVSKCIKSASQAAAWRRIDNTHMTPLCCYGLDALSQCMQHRSLCNRPARLPTSSRHAASAGPTANAGSTQCCHHLPVVAGDGVCDGAVPVAAPAVGRLRVHLAAAACRGSGTLSINNSMYWYASVVHLPHVPLLITGSAGWSPKVHQGYRMHKSTPQSFTGPHHPASQAHSPRSPPARPSWPCSR